MKILPVNKSCSALFLSATLLVAHHTTAAAALPDALGVPRPGPTNDAPYSPQPILQGGVVIPLFAPDSPFLKPERVTEAEQYNMSKAVPGRISSIVNIHNPSIEVHTVEGSLNTGAAVILAAGGGHNTLNVGTESADFVGIIYPGPTPFARGASPPIPRNAPPAFITCAGAGDRVHAIWANEYFTAMLKAGIPNVEMHIYGNGRHPGDALSDGGRMTGGLTHRNGIPFGTWQDRYVDWFADLGFLGQPGVETKAAADTAAFMSQPERGSGRRRGVSGARNRNVEGGAANTTERGGAPR